jgi:integrase/recombinase XerD
MSGLQAHVDEYLRLRRVLGFKLREDERLLGQLVRYLEAAGARMVTSELAVAWARLPVGGASEPVGEATADRAGVLRLPANDRPSG